MLKVRRAHVYLKVGLELDLWSQPIIDGSGNGKLKVVACSRGVSPLEVPMSKADGRYGDQHAYGNPHYWLTPANVPAICANITDALVACDPENAAQYAERRDAYLAKLNAKIAEWEKRKAELANVAFVAYHNSLPYFCDYFGCKVVGFVEEFAGVAPSPSHVARLIDRIKADHIPLVTFQPFHDKRLPELLGEKTGCRVAALPTSVRGVPGTNTYEDLIDTIVKILVTNGAGA
jgi:ABC-type Zn uptake system ZnuABC Zn-binding protein ZnuA